MSLSDRAHVLSVGSAASFFYGDDFATNPDSGRILTKNDEQYELMEPYPSPPYTDSNATRRIPLPGSLSAHSDDIDTSQIGGVLDSPVVFQRAHSPPLSPPPTLPTLTTELPFGDDQTSTLISAPLALERHMEVIHSYNLALSLQTIPLGQESHLLSPLSPEFIANPHDAYDDEANAVAQSTAPFDLGPLGTLLLEEDESPISPSSMFEEDKCPWTPHSLYSTLGYIDVGQEFLSHNHQDQRHLQSLCEYSMDHFLPGIVSEQLGDFPYPSSPLIAHRELDLDGYSSYFDHYGDYGGAPGSQSPCVRTLDLQEDNDEAELGLSLASFPAPGVNISPMPPPTASSLFSSECDWDPSSSTLDATTDSTIAVSAPGSSLLLLDVDFEYNEHAPMSLPSPSSSSISSSPDILLESLDSRIFNLGEADLGPEYVTLMSHPELQDDLRALLALRRQAQVAEKAAKCREHELEMSMSLQEQERRNISPDVKITVPQMQEKFDVRSSRKRQKERCREIGALVSLTLFGESKPITEKSSSQQNSSHMNSSEASTKLSKKVSKKKRSITSMAQLVARMVLRRRDASTERFTSRQIGSVHHGLCSPPGGSRPYTRSPLWQCVTVDDQADDLEDDDDDSLGLGAGLNLKGFGDFQSGQ
ncbi:hypothetical protein BDP27DRAFT_1314934 [Rhodocollybia butyracea]|uniref:Uncharacterized protein n=1 Tax=Rhodocollybia butyracea TaxID=206335 RepID=A0A9P5Q6J6_9AGAR|nr:hypothetical protein BDP27DRAFT_1314934 [Rhodocollybia butyracea]